MFDLDGIGPKIRALYTTFLNWTQGDADDALAAINTNLDAPISGITSGGKRRAVKITSGSSWTHAANIKDSFVQVTMVAGGGAGGRQSGDGGTGAGGGEVIYRAPYFLSGGSTATTIPAAKAGRATNGVGADGDNCVFGTLIAHGGKGGLGASVGSKAGGDGGGGWGGVGSTSTPDPAGQAAWRMGGGAGGELAYDGEPGISAGGVFDGSAGGGGGSWGPGGNGVTAGGSGANATEGGGGGGCTTGTSGAGGAGFIIVEWEEAP